MSEIKLSLVIPVYNEEKYIAKCLDSCLKQDISYTDYEIIVVNNGSTDNSLSIIEEYVAKYPNVIVHTQENKIAGGARNYGILYAKGDYIWFIDGDDWIKDNCLSDLIGFEADIVLFPGYYRWIDNEITTVYIPTPQFHEIAQTKMAVFPWAVLHKREFLLKKKLFCLENTFQEDLEFAPKVYCCAESIEYIRRIVYFYRKNTRSVTLGNWGAKKCEDFLKMASLLLKDKQKYASDNKEWDAFFNHFFDMAVHLFLSESMCLPCKERNLQYKLFQSKRDIQQSFSDIDKLGIKLKIFLLNHSYKLLYFYLYFEYKWVMPFKYIIKKSE